MSTIIFYDGGCPLCEKEIRHYIKLDQAKKVCWIDITQDQKALESYGITLEAAMRRIHGISTSGRQVTGAYAFVLMWQALPYYRHLAKIISTLRLTPLLDWGYGHFATWRYRRRCSQGCAIK